MATKTKRVKRTTTKKQTTETKEKTMATKKKPTKAIQKKESAALAERPDFIDGDLGETLDQDEMLIPRVELCQALSPQLQADDPKYIEDLKAGHLFNSATGVIYGENIRFISLAYKKEYLVFQDRKQGGGFGGSYATEKEAMDAIDMLDGEGWEPNKALSNLIMIVDEEGNNQELAYLSCTRTKIKAAKKMNTYLKMVNAPRFATFFNLDAVKERNKEGQPFHNFSISPAGWVTDRDLYEEAEQIAKTMLPEKIKGDFGSEKETDTESEDF